MKKKRCLKKRTFNISIAIVEAGPACKRKTAPKITHKRTEKQRGCNRRKQKCRQACSRRVPIPIVPAKPRRSGKRRYSRPVLFLYKAGSEFRCVSGEIDPPVSNGLPPPIPVSPAAPACANGHTMEKECCGNLLIQGRQTGYVIWQSDNGLKRNVLTIAVYSSQSSTEAIPVEIEGAERKRLEVPPGNTVTVVGHDIQSVAIPATTDSFMYAEGKYVITATFPFPGPFV